MLPTPPPQPQKQHALPDEHVYFVLRTAIRRKYNNVFVIASSAVFGALIFLLVIIVPWVLGGRFYFESVGPALFLGSIALLLVFTGSRIKNLITGERAGDHYVVVASKYLRENKPSERTLQTMERLADLDRSSIQTSGLMANIVWAVVIAFVAFADRLAFEWNMAISSGIVVLITVFMGMGERDTANITLLKAIALYKEETGL
jgi:hypothetical protein